MVRFRCLIHKATGTVIKYEEWLEEMKNQGGVKDFPVEKEITNGRKLVYRPKQAIFSDDFEIIYESEFTTLELIQLYANSGELRLKLKRIIDERHNLKRKYRTEV